MTELIPYDVARTALAEAKAVDDVKHILDKAVAMKVYAKRAADRTMEIDAAEIRFHAERRLGQMIVAQKETVGFNRGAAAGGSKESSRGTITEPRDTRPTLADTGISKKLSSHAQKMAAVPAPEFEARLGAWRDEVSEAGARVTMDLLKIGEAEQQRQARRDLAQALSDTALELTGERKYPAGYIDFPWRRKQGLTDRSYENHYPTMTWDEIIEWCLKWRDRFLDDSWFFIWIPRAHMFALHPVEYTILIDDGSQHKIKIPVPLGWAVARALGADAFSTAFIWTKTDEEFPDDIGSGILVRDQDEVLLMFKRGRGLPKPKSDEIVGSNHRERSRPLGHSRKPQFYREMIAKMTGGVPVLECFARHDAEFPLPENWDSWGNQAAPADEKTEPENISEAAE